MAIILPGGVIGGKLAPSWTHRARFTSYSGSTTNPRQMTGVSFGDAVTGANKKWGIVMLHYVNQAAPLSLGSATIGGVTASYVFNTTLAAMANTGRIAAFTADISAVSGTGTVEWNDGGTTTTIHAHFLTAINIDCSTVSDSASGSGSSGVTLAIDCPAKGGIVAESAWLGGSVSTVTYQNLPTLNNNTGSVGTGCGAAAFTSAQTNLDVSVTQSGTSFSGAFALSFAGV